MRTTLYRSSRTNAEGNAGRQGATLCRNPSHVLLVLCSLDRQLEIRVAVHRVWHKDIKNWSWLIENILKLLTTKIQGTGKVENSPILLAVFDSLLILHIHLVQNRSIFHYFLLFYCIFVIIFSKNIFFFWYQKCHSSIY